MSYTPDEFDSPNMIVACNKYFDSDTIAFEDNPENARVYYRKTLSRLKEKTSPSLEKPLSIEEEPSAFELKMKEIRESKEDDTINSIPIVQSTSEIEKELSSKPYLKSQFIFGLNSYRDRNSAQKLNVRGWYNRFGKLVVRECGNTYIGDKIASIKPWHFGCLEANTIEAVPESVFRLKGTEITKISSRGLKAKGKHLIRRGALTNILKKWCYVVGIRYSAVKFNKENLPYISEECGVQYWARDILGDFGKLENDIGGLNLYITGRHGALMLKDLRFLIRDKSWELLEKYANRGAISHQLYMILTSRAKDEEMTLEKVIMDMKSRLYYDSVIYDTNKDSDTYGEPMIEWAFPKINMEYLNKVIKQLSDGKIYFNDIYIPLIINTRLYPIKCSETRVTPISNEVHSKRKDDYDTLYHLYRDEERGEGN